MLFEDRLVLHRGSSNGWYALIGGYATLRIAANTQVARLNGCYEASQDYQSQWPNPEHHPHGDSPAGLIVVTHEGMGVPEPGHLGEVCTIQSNCKRQIRWITPTNTSTGPAKSIQVGPAPFQEQPFLFKIIESHSRCS
jgi:hypothetical protein